MWIEFQIGFVELGLSCPALQYRKGGLASKVSQDNPVTVNLDNIVVIINFLISLDMFLPVLSLVIFMDRC